jgi:hypothetical protein
MDESRRKFFNIGAVAIAAAAIPFGAIEINKTDDEAIGPIMYEHVCDHGKSGWNPKDLTEYEKEHPGRVWGCGTRFRWYFGVPPFCPKCGWAYEMTIKAISEGRYKLVSG